MHDCAKIKFEVFIVAQRAFAQCSCDTHQTILKDPQSHSFSRNECNNTKFINHSIVHVFHYYFTEPSLKRYIFQTISL